MSDNLGGAAKSGAGSELSAARLPALFTGSKGPLIGLVLLCVALSLTTDTFLTVRNILNVLDQVTVLGIMAIGMTLVILIGGIDLSVGSVLALAGMVMGAVAHPDYLGMPVAIGIAAALLVRRRVRAGLGAAGHELRSCRRSSPRWR